MIEEGLIISPEDLLNKIMQKSTTKREGAYEDAPNNVIELAQKVIAACPELAVAQGALIRYLFKTGSWSKLGECSRTTGKWRKLTGYDYVIVFHKDTWSTLLSENQREALMHHELSHISRTEDTWCLTRHDVEEFLLTYKRYGAWSANLRAMQLISAQGDGKIGSSGTDERARG
jgi:hypothetical protein